MSLFKKIGDIFNSESESKADFGWASMHVEDELSDMLKASNTKPQVIYKHSNRCATSFFALKNIQRLSEEERRKADFYMVDVIGQRALSSQISEMLGVRHESPQLIILKDGEVCWHGSHHNVGAEAIEVNI